MQNTISIIVFPEHEEPENSDGSIDAKVDNSLRSSIISTGMLKQVRVSYQPGQQESLKNSKNTVYNPVGKIDLRWHKRDKVLSHSETFYIVDQTTPLVVLGATACPASVQPSEGEAFPVGVYQQTLGNHSLRLIVARHTANILSVSKEEKAAIERKRREVAERRALETKEQEEKEAQRRQQQSQNK